MGSINSKLSYDNNNSHLKTSNYCSSSFYSQSFSSCIHKRHHSINFHHMYNKRRERLCLKKKVLILGLDGVGKTDFFTRLISYYKQELNIHSFPRPTIGYNVETIKFRSHHLYSRQYHKITLWDCGGESSVRSLWPYHYSNTSLLIWLINIHDRLRLDMNLQLLSQILTNSLLYRVPVLIILYNCTLNQYNLDENIEQNLLTNLEVSFRFLAMLSTSRASTFKWQVINITLNDNNNNNNDQKDFKKLQQCFRELMEL